MAIEGVWCNADQPTIDWRTNLPKLRTVVGEIEAVVETGSGVSVTVKFTYNGPNIMNEIWQQAKLEAHLDEPVMFLRSVRAVLRDAADPTFQLVWISPGEW